MTTLPPTFRDVTDDVCPRPRHGRPPTPEECGEAVGEDDPPEVRGTGPRLRKKGSGKPLELYLEWRDNYSSEREWLIALLEKHGTGKEIARVLGYSRTAIQRRIHNHGIPMQRGRGWMGGDTGPER